MSVRRLAEEAVQPAAFAFNRSNASWAKKKLKDYPKGRQASAVIPLLMRAQEQDGWVTKAAIEHVATMLDMPMIRVLEVATFYTQFQLAPVGKRAHVQVCGTTPCMLRGAGDLIETCKKRISPNPFDVSEDGNLSWEEVECQGACVNAPMVMIFKDTYEDLTPERLEEIIDTFDAGKGTDVPVGPQIDRWFSAAEGGATTLTSNPNGKKASPAKAKKATKTDKPLKATKAGGPASHASETSVAVKTPTGKTASRIAAKEAGQARKEAGTPSPKKRAEIAGNVGRKAASLKAAGPERLKKPKGKADDLKLISGVGPKLEGTLNGLGFWHFSQIAQWKKADAAIVDSELTFKGRIERDDWIKQAKKLAKGAK